MKTLIQSTPHLFEINNTEIIIDLSIPQRGDKEPNDEIVTDILDNALNQANISLKHGVRPNSYTFTFKDFQAFQEFCQYFMISGHQSESNSQPFRIQLSFERFPEAFEQEKLLSLVSGFFNRIKLPFKEISGTGVYEAQFPSEAAYLATMLETLQKLCGFMIQ